MLLHLDPLEPLRRDGRDAFDRSHGGVQRVLETVDPVGRGIGVEQDRDRLHQAKASADDEQQRRRRLGDRGAAERVAEIGRHEHDGAEQDVHRDLRRHDHLEGFGLGADLDVGRGLRHFASASSNRSSLRARLSLTSLKPSRKSISRSNSRRSHAADSPFCAASRLFLRWKMTPAPVTMTTVSDEGRERQIGDIKSDEEDQHRALHREAQHVARLRQHRGVAGDGGDDPRRGRSSPDRAARSAGSCPSAARRSLWMIASISAVAVMVTYCCVLMNRNSAIRNSEAAHRPGFWPLPESCTPALMAARIEALLTPPMPDMKTSFGIEPCISRRTSWMNDMSALPSVYISTRAADSFERRMRLPTVNLRCGDAIRRAAMGR